MVSLDEQDRTLWNRRAIDEGLGQAPWLLLGLTTAAILAYRGAHVVLAVRNLEKGAAALSRMVAANRMTATALATPGSSTPSAIGGASTRRCP